MNQPAVVAPTPTPLLRRAVAWWLAQVKHALPPTIFFFVGFNLILWTKRLILEEHGVEFSGFLTATVAALLVGKAVLVTDNLPFVRRFDGAQPSGSLTALRSLQRQVRTSSRWKFKRQWPARLLTTQPPSELPISNSIGAFAYQGRESLISENNPTRAVVAIARWSPYCAS